MQTQGFHTLPFWRTCVQRALDVDQYLTVLTICRVNYQQNLAREILFLQGTPTSGNVRSARAICITLISMRCLG